jgi:hypothetical protein
MVSTSNMTSRDRDLNHMNFPGITLLRSIENAFDTGNLVIVPRPPKEGEIGTKWICVLVEGGLHPDATFKQGGRWKVSNSTIRERKCISWLIKRHIGLGR